MEFWSGTSALYSVKGYLGHADTGPRSTSGHRQIATEMREVTDIERPSWHSRCTYATITLSPDRRYPCNAPRLSRLHLLR
jgi:hypothetical protein